MRGWLRSWHVLGLYGCCKTLSLAPRMPLRAMGMHALWVCANNKVVFTCLSGVRLETGVATIPCWLLVCWLPKRCTPAQSPTLPECLGLLVSCSISTGGQLLHVEKLQWFDSIEVMKPAQAGASECVISVV